MADSKVTEFTNKVGIKEDIGGFYFTMNDAMRFNEMKIHKD